MTDNTVVPFPASTTTTRTMNDLSIITCAQLLSKTFSQRGFVIEPILRERQVAMIYAPTGVGKTWMTLSLAVAAASGHDASFLGFTGGGDGRKTLVIDGEMDEEDLQQRTELIIEAVSADRERVGKNLIVVSRQAQKFDCQFPDIADEDWQNAILEHCEKHRVEVLFLDNFSTLSASLEDENSSAKIGKVNSMLLKAKAAGVTCVLVHHSNKKSESYRGSSAIAVTLDMIVALSRPDNYVPAEQETAFVLKYDKVRGSIPRHVLNERIVVLKTNDGHATWSEDDHPASQGQLIKLKLQSLRFTSQKELAADLGMSEGNLSKKITAAIAAAIFKRDEMDEWFRKARDIRKANTENETNISDHTSVIDDDCETPEDEEGEGDNETDPTLTDPTMF